MIHARITGTGSYAPKKIATNQDLEKLVDTSDAWILERTGIRNAGSRKKARPHPILRTKQAGGR